MTEPFTHAELQQFDADGFIVVRGMYDTAEVSRISEWLIEIAARPATPGGDMVYLEDDLRNANQRIVSRIEKFADHHDGLRNFIHAEPMVERVSTLIGAPPVLFKEKINLKLPGGGGFEPHQDIQPGWDDYAPYFLSVLVTIDASDETNGCLELAAGHHKRGMLGERWKPLTEEQLAGVTFTPYPTAPGDVVFFDCFVPHRSAPNFSDSWRRNVYLTFNRQQDGNHREAYFADKRRQYPPDCEREAGQSYRFRV